MQWAQVRRANVLRARPHLPANSTEGKETKIKEKEKKKTKGGTKGTAVDAYSGVLAYDRPQGSTDQKIELSTRQSYTEEEEEEEEEEEDDGGKKGETEAGFLYPRNAPRIRMATVGGA